jgi:bacterioferritin
LNVKRRDHMPGLSEERRRVERRKKNAGPSKGAERRKAERRVGAFTRDIVELRRRARKQIEKGAVTASYGIDPEVVVGILNEALATEIVCVLRYKRHYFMATGIHAQTVAAEFLQHANEEQTHADQIAARITQLGGSPNFDPEGLATRSHSQYVEGGSLVDMIKEDLVAERIAIESYSEIVRFLGDKDITTRRLMESILAMEEEHADDLMNLLTTLDPSKKG